MFGEQQPARQRAEIISFDEDGKQKVDKGGVMQTPLPSPQSKPSPKPAAAEAPLYPTPRPAPAPKPAPKAEVPAPTPNPVSEPVPVAIAPAPKPVPARPKLKVKNPASAKEVSKALAADTVGSFVDRMRETAMAKGGTLTLGDIDAMQSDMAEKTKEIEAQMEAAFETYAKASDRLKWGAERRDVFYRLLVKQFSHMFKEPVARKTVCRRMLPGLFMALDMLMGPDAVENYDSRCRSIVARLKSEHGDDPFDWDIYYSEKDALSVGLDAQVLIAAGFAEYDKRTQWFLTLVNSHLAPIQVGDSEAVQRWELAEPGLRRMLDALLANLRKVLSSDKGRERLIKRHGAEIVSAALQTLKRIVTG